MQTDSVRDFVKKLSDEEIKFLQPRLSQRLGGDLGEAAEFIGKNHEMDCFLCDANSTNDCYARLDHIEAMLSGEIKKREALLINESKKRIVQVSKK